MPRASRVRGREAPRMGPHPRASPNPLRVRGLCPRTFPREASDPSEPRESAAFARLRGVVELGPSGVARLGTLLRKARNVRDHRPVEGGDVRPVQLYEVSSRVADVHLDRPIRKLTDGGAERSLLEDTELLRLEIGGLEVVDVERDVVELGSRRVAQIGR